MMFNHNGMPVEYWACTVTRNGFSSLLLVLGTEEEMHHFIAEEWYRYDGALKKEKITCRKLSASMWDEFTRYIPAYVAPPLEGVPRFEK